MRKGRGEVIKIGDLFEKYRKNLKAPQGSVIKVFQEVVFELLSIKIKKECIKYSPSTKVLSVGLGGVVKSEIKLHKEEILAHMNGRLGEKSGPKEIL
jgi:hypothetical protein